MIVEQRDLELGLQIVQGAAARRTTIPALAAIKMEAENEGLRLSATDLEIAIETRVKARDVQPFKAWVPREQFLSLINGLPAGEITLTPDKYSLEVRWTDGSATITTANGDDGLALLPPKLGLEGTIVASDFRKALRQGTAAMSELASPPELAGCLFEFGVNSLRLVSTDAFRVAIATAKGVTTTGIGKYILPYKAVTQLLRLLPQEKPVKMLFGETALFEFGDVRMISRLIAGNYPNVDRVIPQSFIAKATVDADALVSTVKRVALFAGDDLTSVILELNGKINLSARSDLGQAQNALEAVVEGRTEKIIFNSNFLLQGIAAMETDKVILEFTGPLTPAKIHPAEQENAFYVLLPIRPKAGEQVQGGKEAAGG